MAATRLALNVPLLRRKVRNVSAAARSVGLRPATISNLCSGKTDVRHATVGTLEAIVQMADCRIDDLLLRLPVGEESIACSGTWRASSCFASSAPPGRSMPRSRSR